MSTQTTEALLYLIRVREAEVADHVEALRDTAKSRFWHYGHGWRPWAKMRLPRAEKELIEIRRHIANLEAANA